MAHKLSELGGGVKVGAKFQNRYNQTATIVSINGYKNIEIEWGCGKRSITNSQQLRTGAFKNPYRPLVRGVGYLGVGEFKSVVNGKRSREYEAWVAMLTRCYSEDYLAEYPTYQNHKVSEEWHDFQNFAKWYVDKSKVIPDGEVWHLDKDLMRGVDYAPDVCVLIPPRLNMLLVKNDARRANTMIGVSYDKSRNKYRARCHNGTRRSVHLGWRDSEDEAFQLYKSFKESLIKQLAEEYKPMVSQEVYEALMRYEVKETD